MIKYACQVCGFASRELFLGPGSDSKAYDPVLVSCTRCKTLRSVHRPDVARGCRKHRRPFTRLDHDGPIACPRCATALVPAHTGLWD